MGSRGFETLPDGTTAPYCDEPDERRCIVHYRDPVTGAAAQLTCVALDVRVQRGCLLIETETSTRAYSEGAWHSFEWTFDE